MIGVLAQGVRLYYHDEHLMVLGKPAGMLSHPTGPKHTRALTRVLEASLARQDTGGGIHLVSRLDRDTSGLMLVARQPGVHRLLQQDRPARQLRRHYLAVAAGQVSADEGRIEAPIGRVSPDSVLRMVREDGAPAVTLFRVLERYQQATLLGLELLTGRTHQIRVHLQHCGHPLLGDQWYARTRLDLISRQALHSAELSFEHPVTGEQLHFKEALPEDMATLQRRLRGEGS